MGNAQTQQGNLKSGRLITQNLLTSAALFERQPAVTLQSFQDLIAFIDIFCLYDHAITLNRTGGLFPTWDSGFFSLLKQEGFVREADPDADQQERIIDSANGHLAAYLGNQVNTDRFNDLLPDALFPGSRGFLSYQLCQRPDDSHTIAGAVEWLAKHPTRESFLERLYQEKEGHDRSVLFLARSFLYFGCADVLKVGFTPDSARHEPLLNLLRTEADIAEALLRKIRLACPPEDAFPEYVAMHRRVTPFAAIVFGRAQNKYRIVPELQNLRRELTGVRSHLAELEQQVFTAEGSKKTREAEDKYKAYMKAIQEELGSGRADAHQVWVVPLLSVSLGVLTEIGASLMTQPGQSWEKAVATASLPALATQIPLLVSILRKRSSVDLHAVAKIKEDMPSSKELAENVKHLFELDTSDFEKK